MTTKTKSAPQMEALPVNDEQRHALVLRAWEAINAERELEGVLAAVGDVLAPLIPFEGVALARTGGGWCDAYAFHIPHSPHESRGAEEVWRAYAVNPLPVRPEIPIEGSDLWREQDRKSTRLNSS